MRFHGPGTGLFNSCSRGLTLPEALVVIAVSTILLGITIPSFSGAISRNRASGAMMELHGMLATVRQQALMRHIEITLCGTRNGVDCDKVWDGNPTLIFVDKNSNRRHDADEELIAHSQLTDSGQIRWRASGNRNYLRYRPDGSVKELGSFRYCPRDLNPRMAREIVLSATGRARSATDSNGDGIVEDRYGNPLSC